mmetsp:Transcript_15913/g.26818  ORF Transcript_15913/g.26818 Transcript_15913/m.26818 type:complete len:220 (+) Transcript_15913:166-825(+)
MKKNKSVANVSVKVDQFIRQQTQSRADPPEKPSELSGCKTLRDQMLSERQSTFLLKYNLSPEYQHVKASFRDTSEAVRKLRQQAQEMRESIREKKKVEEGERLPQWGVDYNKYRPKSTRKSKSRVNITSKEDMMDEMVPVTSEIKQRSLRQAEKSQAKREKLDRANQVLERLLHDAEQRQKRKELIVLQEQSKPKLTGKKKTSQASTKPTSSFRKKGTV